MSPPARPAVRWLLIALAFVALTALYLRPSAERLTGAVVSDLGDPLFNLVILEWVQERAAEGFDDLWNPPFFHPTRGTLALSDHLLGPALLVAPLRTLLPTPAARYNALVLFSFALTGLTTAWVLRRSGASLPAAFAGACVFAFSPFRWDHLAHLQLLLAPWVPVTLYLFDRLLAEPRPRQAALFLTAYALHVTGGAYLAVMLHVPLAVVVASRWAALGSRLLARRSLAVLAPTAVACVLLLAPIYLPYLQLRDELGISRSKREIVGFGATLGSLLTPSERTWYAGEGWLRWHRAENALFPGFLPLALAATGAVAGLRRRRRRAGDADPSPTARGAAAPPWWRWPARAALLLAAAAGALLADAYTLGRLTLLGVTVESQGRALPGVILLASLAAWLALRRRWGAPPLTRLWRGADPWQRSLAISGLVCLLLCFPLFYLPARHLLPGLVAMRVPARFFAFASLSIAWLAALGFDALRARVPCIWRPAAMAALAAGLLVEMAPRGVAWHEISSPAQLPPLRHWLAANEQVEAILELPFPAHHHQELPRMYAQLLHRRPLANGYSGYLPPSYLALRQSVDWEHFDPWAMELLRDLGISHLVLHLDELDWPVRRHKAAFARFEGRYFPTGEAELDYLDDHTVVYRLADPPTSPVAGRPPRTRPPP